MKPWMALVLAMIGAPGCATWEPWDGDARDRALLEPQWMRVTTADGRGGTVWLQTATASELVVVSGGETVRLPIDTVQTIALESRRVHDSPNPKVYRSSAQQAAVAEQLADPMALPLTGPSAGIR